MGANKKSSFEDKCINLNYVLQFLDQLIQSINLSMFLCRYVFANQLIDTNPKIMFIQYFKIFFITTKINEISLSTNTKPKISWVFYPPIYPSHVSMYASHAIDMVNIACKTFKRPKGPTQLIIVLAHYNNKFSFLNSDVCNEIPQT